jgi:hypothetical protein
MTSFDPNIFDLSVVKLAKASGSFGAFNFGLQCQEMVSVNSCKDVDFSTITAGYRLVEARSNAGVSGDGFLDDSDTDITFEDLENAFDSNTVSPTAISVATHWVNPTETVSNTALANGGLKILAAGHTALAGANTSDSNIDIRAVDDSDNAVSLRYMYLIVGYDTSDEDPGYDSYQYWKISINESSQ